MYNNEDIVEFNTKQELYDYLNNFDFTSKKSNKDGGLSSVYFLVEFDGEILPVYFMPFEGSWFESPCYLHKFLLKDEELINYVRERYGEDWSITCYEYERMFQKDNWHYEIECLQCEPFLPDKTKIIKPLSEEECLDWLLKHKEER